MKNPENMKTIAFYMSSLRKGGAERVISNLAIYFYEKGYRVVLTTTWKAEEEYTVPAGIIRRFSEPKDEELSHGRVGNFLTRCRKLRQIWKEEKPDLIVSFIGKNNIMAILTSMGLSVPVAVSVRGDPQEEYYNTWLRLAARVLFQLTDGVILQTGRCLTFFPKSVKKKAVILKNPIHEEFFREPYTGEREHTVVAVGCIDENKNHKLLIDAFALLAGRFPDYRLIIYGDGEKRAELQKYVEEKGLSGQVHLPGSITNVADTIYKTSVFVLPSKTEGMPNTLIEAMVLGLPVIATDCPCGGPAELIKDGVNGLLTPVDKVDEMKEKLQNLLDNLQVANALGSQALRTRDIYWPEKVYEEWESYLVGLMK